MSNDSVKLKTLDEHNKQRWPEPRTNEPVKNGIACPKCSDELLDSSPLVTLTSWPPQKNVHCDNCGYAGYRVA